MKLRMLLVGFAVFVLVAGIAFLAINLRAGDKAPAVGTAAPEFHAKLPGWQARQPAGFSRQMGGPVFYPKDMTSGCTIEAHNFQRDLSKYDARNAVILGVSVQDEKSHQEFCAKESLNFKLLADTEHKVSEEYGSLTNYGVAKLSARHTFLIDPTGKIRKVWTDVDVKKHSDEVFAALDELSKSTG